MGSGSLCQAGRVPGLGGLSLGLLVQHMAPAQPSPLHLDQALSIHWAVPLMVLAPECAAIASLAWATLRPPSVIGNFVIFIHNRSDCQERAEALRRPAVKSV